MTMIYSAEIRNNVTGYAGALPAAFSMGEAAKQFIEYLDAKPRTTAAYMGNLRQFAGWMDREGISAPKRADILKWRDYLMKNHKPSTVQAYITAVRLFFSWTAQEGIYPNIAEHIKGAKIDRSYKKDYLTPSQVRNMLSCIDTATAKGKRDYALVLLMVTGGLRDIEVSRATVGDIHTLGTCTVLYLQGKGRDEKTEFVKLTEQSEKAIREYLATRKRLQDSSPLFSNMSNNSEGKPITSRGISGIVKHYLIMSGLNSPRITAHSLRHTAVTLSLMGGCSIEEVQQFARHSNINTTMIYAHQLDRVKGQCESTISNAIFQGEQ